MNNKVLISSHFTYKKLLKYVFPSILMMVVTSVYGVIDGLFVSNYVGKTPFAAINLIMPVIMILGGTGFMIGTGGTALVTKIIGEGDRDKANKYFSMFIVFSIFLGIVLLIIGEAVMRPLTILLGASDDMVEYSVIYGRIVVAFIVFFMLQNIFQSFLAAAEKPQLGLIITIIAGLTNAALDALFIVVFKWGVAGAAIATGIGQIVGGVIPVIYFLRKNDSLLKLVKPEFEIKAIIKACGNGSSELLTNISSSLVSMVYNAQLMKFFGENGVSSYGVLMYVQFIFCAIIIGFTIGSAPIIAYNYGAKNELELKNVFKKSIVFLVLSGLILCASAEILAVPLAKIFVGYDQDLYKLTVFAFRIFSLSFIFSSIAIYSSGFFTALNNGLVSAILSIMRSLVLQVSFVFLLPIIFGINGIWWAMFATEAAATLISVIFFICYRKKYRYY